MPNPLEEGRRALARGRTAEAARQFERHLKAKPHDADAWQLLGIARFQAGNVTGAREAMEKGTQAAPKRADAWVNLGVVLCQQDAEAALSAFREAERLEPNNAETEVKIGFVLLELGRPKEAAASLRTALALNPDLPEAHFQLGNALRALGRLEDALGCFRRTLALQPAHLEGANNLGTTLLHLGRADEAARVLEELTKREPRFAPGLLNLAATYDALGQRNLTVTALQKLTAAQPKLFEPWLALGNALREQSQPEAAKAAFERALAVRPGEPRALTERANLLQDMGERDAARASLGGGSDVERVRRALVLPVIPSDREEIAKVRQQLAEELADLRVVSVPEPATAGGAYPFHLAYQGIDNRDLMQTLGEFWLRTCPDLAWEAPTLESAAPGEPIRLGVVSAFWRDHTVGRLFGDLVASLDPHQFEVHLFLVGGRTDDLTRRWAERAARMLRLAPDLATARRQIADARPHVLLYPEVGMDGFTYFLSFARLAPFQAVTWGHPETTGSPNIDAFLSAEDLEAQGAEQRYTETLIRLPRLGIGFQAPEIPEPVPREAFDLPEGRLYGCPQSLFKIHPDFDDALECLAAADPQARFVFVLGRYPGWEARLRARWSSSAPSLAKAAIFLPSLARDRYLALLPQCDVLLDPFHFGGGHTSFEAFCMGRPVVTLPGAHLRNRITLAAYRQLEVEGPVAKDPDEFVRLARTLADDPAETDRLGSRIREALPRLFDLSAAAAALAGALATPPLRDRNRR